MRSPDAHASPSTPLPAGGAASARPDRFEALFEQAPFSIQVLDSSGRTLRVNRAWKALWQAEDDFVRWVLADYNILEDAQLRAGGVLPLLQRAFEGETVRIPALRYDPVELGCTGRARWVKAQAQPVLGHDGRVQEVVLIHEDVTDEMQSHAVLQDWQRRLQRVFEANPIGMVTGDSEGRLHDANDAFLRIVGFSREELRQGLLRWDVITLPEHLALDQRAIEQVRRDGISAVYEKEYLRRDGQRVPVMLAAAHFGEGVEELVAFVIDITERKRTENTLEAVLEALPVGVCIADPGGRIMRMNAANRALWGSPPVAQHWREYGGWVGHCPQTGRRLRADEWALSRALLEGRAVRDELVCIEPFDGSPPRYTLNSAAPVRDAGGTLIGAVVAQLDVDREHRALQALEERSRELAASQQRLELALAAGGMGAWDWTLSDGESVWNEQMYALLGLPVDPQRRGRADWVFERVHPEDLPRLQARIARALEGSDGFEDEFRLLRADGQQRWLAGFGRVIRDAQGRAERLLGLNFDVTQRRATEQQLREMDVRRNEFLAMLAHELRNPLAPISNAVLLLQKELPPERRRAVVEMVQRQSAHMARLVDDLLEVSRVTQGRIELRRERLQLAQALLPALEAARLLAREQQQGLAFDVPSDLELQADPARLTQIVGNLLTNAVKYTPAGGQLRVSARASGPWVEIAVQDNGLGLDEGLLPRVFDLFAQGATTLERSRGGLGLGLTLVRRLVELHGGEVEAASAGAGRGATFTVRLPRLEAGAALAPAHALGTADTPRLAPMTVLVVDDNADAAESLALLLQLDGHEVRVAHNGPQGLEMARQWRPRALLLDLGLPGLDGYAVARALRADPGTAAVAIVAVSGYGQDSDREKTRRAGFDAHLVKPVGLDEAYRALAPVLAPSTAAARQADGPPAPGAGAFNAPSPGR